MSAVALKKRFESGVSVRANEPAKVIAEAGVGAQVTWANETRGRAATRAARMSLCMELTYGWWRAGETGGLESRGEWNGSVRGGTAGCAPEVSEDKAASGGAGGVNGGRGTSLGPIDESGQQRDEGWGRVRALTRF